MKSLGLAAIIVGTVCVLFGAAVVMSGRIDSLILSTYSSLSGKPLSPHWIVKMRLFGLLISTGGIFIGVFGLLASTGRAGLIITLARKDAFVFSITAATLVLLWLPVVLSGQSASFSGERYWWLHDDAMISMRYAHNLAHGIGPVWNQGERIEGYTNFLWMSVMALVHLFHPPESKASLIVLLVNIALALAVIHLLIRLIRILGGEALAAWAAPIIFVLNGNAMLWTAGGLETMLLTCFVLLGTYLIVRDTLRDTIAFSTYMVIAVAALVRADAIVLSALLVGFSLIINRRRKRIIVFAAVSAVLPIAHELFRIAYYGDILPNTAYLKVMNWSSRGSAGIGYILEFMRRYPILLIVAVAGSILSKSRIRIAMLGILAAYSVYLASIGGDAFDNLRFFVPMLPLLVVLAVLGAECLGMPPGGDGAAGASRAFRRSGVIRWMLAAGGVVIAGIYLYFVFLEAGGFGGIGVYVMFGSIFFLALFVFLLAYLKRRVEWAICFLCLIASPLIIPGYTRYIVPSQSGAGNVEIGLLLKGNTRPDCRVADFWAGSVFYFSDRYGIDLLGKCDRHVAGLKAHLQGLTPGHNKFDFDYSLGELKPDYVIAHFKLPVDEEKMRRLSVGRGAFTGQLYFDETFRAHYLQHPVRVDTWRTIFARDDSPGSGELGNWKTLSR